MLLFGLDIGEAIDSWFNKFLDNYIWRIFYWAEIGICKVIAWLEEIMMIFTGEVPVKYNGKDSSLIMVFFNHSAVKGIYGGMALIGIAFAFAFAVVSVIRKVLDLRDKQQGVTLGAILGNLLKSIILIASMNLIIVVALTTTNKLIKQVGVAITVGPNVVNGKDEITFTDEQYAAMGRIFNTIGNYSLNPSYRSRYNLNSCYNDIRGDLEFLGRQGVFNYHYVSYVDDNEEKGEVEETWQSLIEELGRAYDYSHETTLDSYDDGLMNAMLDCIETFQKNPNIRVLQSYKRKKSENTSYVSMDRVFFVAATMGNFNGDGAARVETYNKNPGFSDAVRSPFYLNEKGGNIYNYDDVKRAFYTSPARTNYILVYAAGVAIAQEMLVIIVTCAVRIFNLLTLYLASPLVLAALPLDDGGKLKQWTTAFIVQLLGIVGMVMAMRLFIMFLPIIWSPALEVSSSTILSIIIKCVISYGALTAVSRINGILTGILADNAGWQAISAGDMRGNVTNSAAGKLLGSMSASNVGSALWNKTGGAALSAAGNKIGGAIKNATIGKAYTKLTGRDYQTGEKTAETQAKDNAKAQRKQQRQKADLKANLDHAKKTKRDLNGNRMSDTAIDRMQRTYDNMENGMDLKSARAKADVDMAEDAKDEKQDAKNRVKALKNPPPGRLPGNQNHQ